MATNPYVITGPAITGVPHVGQTLTTSNGTWAESPTSYTYQWARAAPPGYPLTSIAGATGKNYTLTSADSGNYVASTVRAYNASGPSTASAESTPVLISTSSSPFTSYTFVSSTSATRTFRSYTFTEGTLKNAALLAASSAGNSSDTGTLGTAVTLHLLAGLSAGTSTTTGDLLAVPRPRHPVWIRTSEGWQMLSPAVGYFTSATHAAGTTISVPQATHQLHATRGLMVTIHNEATGAQEVADVTVSAAGDVTVTFVAPATANSKRLTLIGPYP